MVKYIENQTVFNFSWNQVVQAYWKRYPNPESAHVLTEDTVHREVRGGRLFSTRLLTKTNRVPKWGERLIGAPVVKIIEESVVDPNERIMTTYTRNLGYTRVMSLVEKVVYRVCDDNPNCTVAERSAWVDSQVLGLSRAIQAFGVERFKKHCVQMARGFNFVLANMFPDSAAAGVVSGGAQVLSRKDKIKDAAKKASELAKAKANTLYASCEPTT